MNWKTVFYGNWRGFIALAILMAAIIGSNIIEKNLSEENQKSANSIYEDRLQPTRYLFQIRQLLANKIFLIEHVDAEIYSSGYAQKLLKIDKEIASFFIKYDQTYMTAEEINLFKLLKTEVKNFEQLQNIFINTGQVEMTHLQQIVQHIDVDLMKLSALQEREAKELLHRHLKNVAWSSSLNTLQMVLAICIGILIMLFFAKKKIVLTDMQAFRLN